MSNKTFTQPVPLPSHIHYELLLQLLEQQTARALGYDSPYREQVLELIATVRKALSQQKRLEESCQRDKIEFEYRWSLHGDRSP